jgi:hypothetical protein
MKDKITDSQFPMPKEAIKELSDAMPYGAMLKVAQEFDNLSQPTVYAHLKTNRQRYRVDIIIAFLYAAETHRQVLGLKQKLKIRSYLESLMTYYNVVDQFNNTLTLNPFQL